jgi:hypothetical protein
MARAGELLKSESDLRQYAKELNADFALLKQTAVDGKLPVVQFAAGGIATPADAALMMQMGMDGGTLYQLKSAALHPLRSLTRFGCFSVCGLRHLQIQQPKRFRGM